MKNDSIRDNWNKGYSLVELLVSMSVAMIIVGAVAGLISFSVKMFSNQIKNTDVQKEVQITINQLEDSMRSAKWFTYENASGKTKYAAFGKISTKNEAETQLYFFGEIFITSEISDGKFNIYMNRYSFPDGGLSVSGVADAKAQLSGYAAGTSWADEKYLIATDATKFKIDYKVKPTPSPTPSPTPAPNTITNPISFNIEVEYIRNGMGREIKKSIKDEVTLRNHVEGDVYINGTKNSLVLK